MRLLLIATYFPPQNAAASLRTWGCAKAWSRAGMDVTVLTTAKRPDQRGFSPPCEGFRVVEIECRPPRLLERIRANQVPRNALGNGATAHPGVLARLRHRTGVFGSVRMPDLTDFWVRPASAWAIANGPWEAMVSSAGPYTVHLVARRVKRAFPDAVWGADFRDLWTQNELFHGLFPFTIAERRLESRCLASADVLTTVSEPLARALTYRAGKPVQVITNGFDAELFELLPRERVFPRDGLVRLVYTGTVYPQGQSVEPVLAALARVRATNVDLASRLRLIVAGDRGEVWSNAAVAHDVHDLVEFRGVVDRETALRMQRDADALLILDWKRPGAGVLTSKLFEYLPAGPPILAVGPVRDSAIARLLRETVRGQHVGNDVAPLADALARLARDPASLAAQPDRSALERYSIRHQAERYLEFLRERVCTQS